MTWTDEAIAELKRLHSGGLFSAAEIAVRMAAELHCAISRNAIIGKVLRLGLPKNDRATGSSKPKAARPMRHDRFRPIKAAPPTAPEPMSDTSDDAIPIGQRRTLDQLTNSTCRWPCGDPAMPDFFFCGHESADLIAGRPYCARHMRVAYQPSAPRRPYIPMRNGTA